MQVAAPRVAGRRYHAAMPATLDLAERARFATNVMTRAVVPEQSYAVWQSMNFTTQPPHWSWPNWLTYKWVEALARMRVVCGSEVNLDVEQAMMQALVNGIGADGLLYYPSTSPDQPPGTSYMMGCGRMLLAMAAWYDRDHDPAWPDLMRRMADGMVRVAINRHDYAFYPLESGWSPDGGWQFTQRGGGRVEHFPYMPPDEPAREQQGHEGTVKFDMAVPLLGLVRAYQVTGHEPALDLAHRLARFCLLPSFWEFDTTTGKPGHEHGLFAGHMHGNTYALRALLEYALVTGSSSLMSLVQQSYEHARHAGIARLGWFPGWIAPERFGRPRRYSSICEGCSIGDMVALAARLSEAGIGDYWDDVDHYARNQLIEQQVVDQAAVEQVIAAGQPLDTLDTTISGAPADLVACALGGFGAFGEPTSLNPPGVHGCCTGNGAIGLYYAWNGIVQEHDGVVRVNMLLNRAAPSLDIDSYLPYEGRVVVHVKQARTVLLRLPYWLDRAAVRVQVAAAERAPIIAGNQLVLDGIEGGDTIDITFPVRDDQATYTAGDSTFACRFRGSTLVDIAPRNESRTVYPIYRREHLQQEHAPMQTGERFVSADTLRW